MSSEVLVQVDGVSKKYCRSFKRSLWYGLQDIAKDLNPFSGPSNNGTSGHANQLRRDEFWAVDNVSFELRRGECLGLIGRNGAGKTTLLKLLNGLMRPDGGRIEMRGRVGALIALGAGFNPVLSGRENIYVNSSVLGFSKKETDEKLDEIIDFADIRDFIDAPVQSYSSGMTVRLGFAVATALDPDILLLDEVLAVGDAAFRAKCYARIGKLRERAAVIFVSHSMEQVTRICRTALCMNHGKTAHYGDVATTVQVYTQLNQSDALEDGAFLSLDDAVTSAEVQASPAAVDSGGALDIEVRVAGTAAATGRLRVVFYAEDGQLVAEYDSRGALKPSVDRNIVTFRQRIGPIDLLHGRYRLGVNLFEGENGRLLVWSYKQHAVELRGQATGLAHYQIGASREIR